MVRGRQASSRRRLHHLTPVRIDSWLHPHIEIRESPLHGRGTFATGPIASGEVVTIWAHELLDSPTDAKDRSGELYVRADGTYVWLPPSNGTIDEDFLNHSCDPNVWMTDEVTLCARRNIAAGEELTGDYALWELDPEWVCPWRCRCGSALCRRSVTGRDWELPELQRRYAGHWHPSIEARIAKLQEGA